MRLPGGSNLCLDERGGGWGERDAGGYTGMSSSQQRALKHMQQSKPDPLFSAMASEFARNLSDSVH